MPVGTSTTSQSSAKKASDLSSQAGSDKWLLVKSNSVFTRVMVSCAVVVMVLSFLLCAQSQRCLWVCVFPCIACTNWIPTERVLYSALNLTDESVRPLMRQRIRETTGAEYVFSLHT